MMITGMVTGIEGRLVEVMVTSKAAERFQIQFKGIENQTTERALRQSIDHIIGNMIIFADYPPSSYEVSFSKDIAKQECVVSFTLAIVLAILQEIGEIELDRFDYTKALFVGDLRANGFTLQIQGTVSLTEQAIKEGLQYIFVPSANVAEALLVGGGIKVVGVKSISSLVDMLRTGEIVESQAQEVHVEQSENCDYSDIRGQDLAIWGMEVAAAGGHNVLMIGDALSSKSMIAQRLPTILPDMTQEQKFDVARIYSSVGLLTADSFFLSKKPYRPIRTPHHTISLRGMTGGESNQKKFSFGEMTLAHHGVLFLDEVIEFDNSILCNVAEAKKQGYISPTIVVSEKRPADFQIVAAMQSCPCGKLSMGNCRCEVRNVVLFQHRLPKVLFDMFDIFIHPYQNFDMPLQNFPRGESSVSIKARVEAARLLQTRRYEKYSDKYGLRLNADLTLVELREVCYNLLTKEAKDFLEKVLVKRITASEFDRLLRVARTVADLDPIESNMINLVHLAQAYMLIDNSIRLSEKKTTLTTSKM